MIDVHFAHKLGTGIPAWCGGTQPPTTVTVNEADGELQVDIFPNGANLYADASTEPVATQQFLVPEHLYIDSKAIHGYALRGLAAHLKP